MTRDEARHAHDALHFTPAQTPIRPLQPRHTFSAASASATTTTPSGPPQREVLGFATYWTLSQNANWNYSLLSTVAYFGLGLYSDGTLNKNDSGWTGWNSQDLVNVINGAHQVGTKVVVVIKPSDPAHNSAATVDSIVTSPTATQNAINVAIDAIGSKSIDGVNVDFEGRSDLYPNDQSGFTNFMTQIAQQVHARWPSATVSADTYSGSASWDGGIFKIGDLAKVVDFMFDMAYDMSFGNMPSGGAQAGPNAPLNGWTYNDSLSVSQYLTKAPASKVVLGVPYYGYKWCTVDTFQYSMATRNSYGTVVCPDGSSTPTAATYAQTLIDFGCAQQLQKNWDSTASSPWATWFSPTSGDPCGGNYGSDRELYYDNATSLGLKYDLVNANNLRGTGMWALGYDGSSTDLWNEIALKFVDWKPWVPLGGSLGSGPAVASQGGGKLDAFAAGQDRVLYQKSFDGTNWAPWQPLGGQLSSDPAAVSWAPGRIDVFARGLDYVLYQKTFSSGTWSDWQPLGGQLLSTPAVSSWGVNRLDVFAAGMDRVLYHKVFDGTKWSDWQPLGGQLSSAPGAVSWGPNRIDVVARGLDYALYHKSFDGTNWSGWDPLEGSLSTAGSISSRGSGLLDVFAAGRNGILYYRTFDANGWSPWQWLGGQLSSSPASISTASNRIDVFARGMDLVLYQRSFISP